MEAGEIAIFQFWKLRQKIECRAHFLQTPLNVAADGAGVIDSLALQILTLIRLQAQHEVASKHDQRKCHQRRHDDDVGAYRCSGRQSARNALNLEIVTP